MYKKISDYGIIGNLHSTALVALDGSIDWLCLPHLDSPSIFGAILDANFGGRFSVTPTGEWDSTAEYVKDTNVLVTRFRTGSGVLRVTDFMPVMEEREEMENREHILYRYLEVEHGEMEVEMVFEPRFDYGRHPSLLEPHPAGGLVARHGDSCLSLSSTHPVTIEGGGGMQFGDCGHRMWPACISAITGRFLTTLTSIPPARLYRRLWRSGRLGFRAAKPEPMWTSVRTGTRYTGRS